MSDEEGESSSIRRSSRRAPTTGSDARAGSLAAIREARRSGKKFRQRVEDSIADVYEEVDEEEYLRRGRASDFVVDDDGAGYANSDEEEEEFQENKKKSKKSVKPKETKSSTAKNGIHKFLTQKTNNKEDTVQQNVEDLSEILKQLDQTFETEAYQDFGAAENISFAASPSPRRRPVQAFSAEEEEEVKQEPVFRVISSTSTKRHGDSPDAVPQKKTKAEDLVTVEPEPIYDEPSLEPEIEIKEAVPVPQVQNNFVEYGTEVIDEVMEEDESIDEEEQNGQTMSFYCLDMFETNNGKVYLFGKRGQKSCCVQVTGIERCVYFLPSDEEEMEKLKTEVKQVLTNHKIPICRSKETDVKCIPDSESLRPEFKALMVFYDASLPRLPIDLEGNYFSRVLNTTATPLERLLVSTKLKTPCFLQISNFEEITEKKKSHCEVEYTVNMQKMTNISVDTKKTLAPRVKLMAIKVTSVVSKDGKQNEIVMISVLYKANACLDKANDPQRSAYQYLSFVTKPEKGTLPLNYDLVLTKEKLNDKVFVGVNEKALLNMFLAKFKQLDPDILVTHDSSVQLALLVSRLEKYKITTWSFISRLHRDNIDKFLNNKNDQWKLMAGRLMICSKTSAEELVHAKSYDIDDLVPLLLTPTDPNATRRAMSQAEIGEPFFQLKSPMSLINLIQWGWFEAYWSLRIVLQLNALPLFVNITQIVGGILSRTLMGGRAERNEYLLLHAFHEKGFIPWDKRTNSNFNKNKKDKESTEKDKSKKAQYTGGLVLEPKKGFYEQYIALLDFNSLYPSIIQEFNICFTTIDKCYEEPNENGLPEPPSKSVPEGILPKEIRVLVQTRKRVKEEMKKHVPGSDEYQQLNVRQMGLKLTANSMYGCLGFGMSRFCAKTLAAMITAKGRELLINTKNNVEKKGYNVVYGDTDSIMVNTNCHNYDEAKRLAFELKKQVNFIYKNVELDVDGLFKRLLLLKKKKYAARTVSLSNEHDVKTELKGLDIVRRDWSALARDVGHQVVNQILDSEERDQLVYDIVSTLSDLRAKIDAKTIDLVQFEIFKSLTKNLSEYNDSNSLPHVLLAKRLNATGKFSFRKGDVVKYIICEDGTNNAATQRAYHITELNERKEELKIDAHYYLSSQIHPVILRLCEPFEELDGCQIAEALGMDPRSFKSKVAQVTSEFGGLNLQASSLVDYDLCAGFTFECPACKKQAIIRSTANGQGTNMFLSLEKCPECHVELFTSKNLLKTRLCSLMNEQISRYKQSPFCCDDVTCGHEESELIDLDWTTKAGPTCSQCKTGTLKKTYTLSDLYQQQAFYLNIFDLNKFLTKHCPKEAQKILEANAKHNDLIQFYKEMNSIVNSRLNSNKFNHVSLKSLVHRLRKK